MTDIDQLLAGRRVAPSIGSTLMDAIGRVSDETGADVATDKALEAMEYVTSESARALIAEAAVILLTAKQ